MNIASLIVYPDAHVRIGHTRFTDTRTATRYRIYRRISTASLHRLDRLICQCASYTGTTEDAAFVALLDLPN